MTNDLGFGNAAKRTLAAAAALKPKPVVDPEPPASIVRQMTEQPGTIPQEPLRIVRKRAPKGITNPLNMRLELSLFNRFVNLSLARNLTYAETLEYLLDRANISADGRSEETK